MAKSKSFFGLRSGSTKSFTFSELNGQQITKEKPEKVKNPRTEAQMRQRMLLSTVSAAYSFLKPICNHSFEGVTYNARSMNKFMSLNLDKFKAASLNDASSVAFNSYKDKNINPLAFIVAQGTLQRPSYAMDTDNAHLVLTSATSTSGFSTAEAIYSALGAQKGDLITFVYVHGDAKVADGVYSYTPEPINIVRLMCDQSGTVAEPQNAFTVSSNNSTATVNIEVSGNTLKVTSGIADFGCVILSRKSDNGWLRSNSVIVGSKGVISDISVANQLATYPISEELILNGGTMANNKGGISTNKKVPQLIVDTRAISITKGNTANFPKINGTPSDATVTYTSGSSSIAQVSSNGVITPIANGTTTITATTSETEEYVSATIKINVTVSGFETSGGDGGDME